MPGNPKQELKDTSATDSAIPNSEEGFGASVICDRVEQKIQDKLSKQSNSLEKNLKIDADDEHPRDPSHEQPDASGKNSEIDEDLSDRSEQDLETDDNSEEAEDNEEVNDSEQDEEDPEPSPDQIPNEWVRRRRHIQAHEKQGEVW